MTNIWAANMLEKSCPQKNHSSIALLLAKPITLKLLFAIWLVGLTDFFLATNLPRRYVLGYLTIYM
jgi:hypothetical protein